MCNLMISVRENLRQLQSSLKSIPADRNSDFDTFSRTIPLAFSDFTNRMANFRSQLTQLEAAAQDIEGQEVITVTKCDAFADRLFVIRAEKAASSERVFRFL
jgi:hypothetical protein